MKKTFILVMVLVIMQISVTLFAEPRSFIEQFGITWTFDKEYETGQFANGDWWVKGPVTVTNITPGWDGEKHWSTKNPMPLPRGQQEKVIVPVILDPNTSLISTVSWIIGEPGCPDLSNGVPRPALKKAAVLTVVAENPGSNAFRPPYAGNDKPIYYTSQLEKYRLPQLPLVSRMPNIQEVADRFERVWIDYFAHHGDGTQYTSPSENMPNYGTTYSRYVNEATLLLMLDETELINQQGQNKDLLLMRTVQLGIDLYEIRKHGGYWIANGALNDGRKWPILFTGLMLDHDEMKNIGSTAPSGFHEDQQTFYVTGHPDPDSVWSFNGESWESDGTDEDYDIYVPHPDPPSTLDSQGNRLFDAEGYRLHYYYTNPNDGSYYGHGTVYQEKEEYTEEHRGMPEWGIRHWNGNPQWDALQWGARYRALNGMSFPGFVLAAHIMGQKEVWNHDPLFDYVDRWVDEMTPYTGSQPVHEGLYVYGSDFIMDMWKAYRGYEYVEPEPDDPKKPYDPQDPTGPVDPTDPEDPDDPNDPSTEPFTEPIPEVFNLVIYNNVLKTGNNNRAVIICDLKEAGVLKVIVYDAKGKEIKVLCNEYREAQRHTDIIWNATEKNGNAVGSGIYMVHMNIGNYSESKKIAVIK